MTKPDIQTDLTALMEAELSAAGHEINNPMPIVQNMDIGQPLSLQERIQRILYHDVSRKAHEAGMETLEEAQDFDMPDEDTSILTHYQVVDEEIPIMPEDPAPEPKVETPQLSGVPDPELVPENSEPENDPSENKIVHTT